MSDVKKIPNRLNLVIALFASVAAVFLLWQASHASNGWLTLLCAVMFSYVANTLFSLTHEGVHGVLSSSKRLNLWLGRWVACFFPTSFSLQQAMHLNHHRHNRTELERFDYIQPGETVWLKYAQWYAILTGVYWFVALFGLILYLCIPQALRWNILRNQNSSVAQQTSSQAYLAAMERVSPLVARMELLSAVLFHAGLFYVFDLTWAGWLACYCAFAVNWSSLQYADHAFSPLDVKEGAWNLKVNRLTQAFFLNYHLHLAHHRQPNVSWYHLPKLIVPNEPYPWFLEVWLSMWKGPRVLPKHMETEHVQ